MCGLENLNFIAGDYINHVSSLIHFAWDVIKYLGKSFCMGHLPARDRRFSISTSSNCIVLMSSPPKSSP